MADGNVSTQNVTVNAPANSSVATANHFGNEPRMVVDESNGNVYYDPVTKKLEFDVWVLQKGDKGQEVREVQAMLNSLMSSRYNVGKIDGDFGKKTLNAVITLKMTAGFITVMFGMVL